MNMESVIVREDHRVVNVRQQRVIIVAAVVLVHIPNRFVGVDILSVADSRVSTVNSKRKRQHLL